jgi:hypothetical protein
MPLPSLTIVCSLGSKDTSLSHGSPVSLASLFLGGVALHEQFISQTYARGHALKLEHLRSAKAHGLKDERRTTPVVVIKPQPHGRDDIAPREGIVAYDPLRLVFEGTTPCLKCHGIQVLIVEVTHAFRSGSSKRRPTPVNSGIPR